VSSERNIKVGDLVKLKDDNDTLVGIGLVLVEKDCSELTDIIKAQYEIEPEFIEEIEEFLLFKPIYLVLWQGETISPSESPVWMFSTELKLAYKV
jgi:hypothetical protein